MFNISDMICLHASFNLRFKPPTRGFYENLELQQNCSLWKLASVSYNLTLVHERYHYILFWKTHHFARLIILRFLIIHILLPQIHTTLGYHCNIVDIPNSLNSNASMVQNFQGGRFGVCFIHYCLDLKQVSLGNKISVLHPSMPIANTDLIRVKCRGERKPKQ